MFNLVFKYTGKFKVAAIITPVLMVLEVLFDVLIPFVMSKIIDVGVNGSAGADIDYIIRMGLVMVGLSMCAMICGGLAGYTSAIASSGFVYNIRMAMFKKINTYSFANIEKFEVPSLVTRLTRDMRMLRMAYIAIVRQLFRAPINLFFSALMVYKIDKSLAIVFWIAIPVLASGLFLIAYNAHPRFKVLMQKYDDMNGKLEENFIAIRVVKTFVRERFEKLKFKKTSENVRDFQRKAESIVLLNDPLFNLVMYSCMIAVSWLGGNYIISKMMTVGEFMSYLSYLKQILFSLMMISSIMMQIVFAQASVDRANEVLNEIVDIDDEGNDENLILEDGSIKFENVSFAYSKDARKMSLSDVNLEIASGETIGIIGSTGSSKTTLIQLIPRLYDVTKGSVIVGGHNVKDYKLENLRKEISVVLQKDVLFSGTIEENLLWGDENASFEEIVEATKVAQAHDFIMSFPDGYQTELGQGGVNVSGGQKQRLTIARALLKRPKIIILDDSTSAVDTDTDKRIRQSLKEKLADMTTIIIAQRIASVMEADKIVVMEDGRVTDIGTHDELLKINEVYADLYYTQLKGVS
ncbi:MAG: ABC transporter ATP-binding protein [Bacillota bacterium]|jgi:ATP-binding cassette subfamily B multidrug efflux pump|nr:ABC transporter ATP-binding protein [Bacillota bacterium]NLL26941.1 ABC transporter ATP-binding protein [Erysipelotrichia bacterium]